MGKFVFNNRGRYVYRPNILYRILVKMSRIFATIFIGLCCILCFPFVLPFLALYIVIAFAGSAFRAGWGA